MLRTTAPLIGALGIMNTASKQHLELSLAKSLLEALGQSFETILPSDRPDVIVEFDGKTIGIEVTTFHSDETLDSKGSLARAAEQKAARYRPSQINPSWQKLGPTEGLVARISKKTNLAEAYERQTTADLWLLIATSLPSVGAEASTFAVPIFVDLVKLNIETHEMLCRSRFSTAYIHGHLSHVLFSWNQSAMWHEIHLPKRST